MEDKKNEAPQLPPKPQLCKYSELFQFLHGSDRCLLIVGTITGTIGGLSMPVFVFFFGKLTDSFDPANEGQETLGQITKLSKIYLLLGAVLWVLSFIFFSFWSIISEKVGYQFRYRYLRAVLQQESAWYDEKDPLELPTKISDECAKIQAGCGEKLVMIFNSMAQAIGGFIVAFIIGWKYSLAALGIFPLMFCGITFLGVGIKKGYMKCALSYAKSSSFAEQALNSIKVVSAFGQEKREIENYVRHLDEAKKQGQVGKAIIGFSFGILNFCLFASYAYGLFVGGQFVKAGIYNHNRGRNYTSGDIISIFFGILIGIFSLGASAPNMKTVTEGRIAAYNALQVIHRRPNILIDDLSAIKVPRIHSDIVFQNVSFKYTTREEKALDNITCTIEKGKTTAFVGPSGSGKSTIVKLLERFYDPDSGMVTVNGQDLKQLNLRQFRHKVGYVGQEPVLFNESIKDNMLNAKPDATDEEIIHALEQANAMSFISKLSEGIKTNAGASGGQLSGGEKQRIALARAFLKQPDLLILDEATSALDRKNETEVQKAIENINREKRITTVVIAHRLSTIKKADRIIVIDKGQIKEIGNHESLLEQYPEGVYAKLVNTQQHVGFNAQINEYQDTEEDSIEDIDVPLTKSKSEQEAQTQLEKEMTIEADREKQIVDLEIEELRALRKKKGFFKRLCVHNKPVIFVFIGVIACIISGSLFPTFAVFWARILFIMMNFDNMGSQLLKYCGFMLSLGLIGFIVISTEKFLFGSLAETMSRNIREEAYTAILRKHVGWFDSQENTPGQLNTILSTEVNTLNGASTESVAVMFQSFTGLLVGVALAFFFEWRISLVAIGVAPIMMLSAAINTKVKASNMVVTQKGEVKVNSTVSDTIVNYTTVASFANESILIDKYQKILASKLNREICKSYISGLLFGFAQFMQFGMYTIMFWSGAKFVERYEVNPQDLFTAIFIMMFAAIGAGQAQQQAPAAGKGVEAATKIYNIIDEPSLIDPFQLNTDEIIATKQNIKGCIEFKDVWFRYPTRTDNWILKGLNMTISPNECVGLVGQSGGGKSTIIQLLYRFYDPQKGQILIDGHDIKEYNIRSLRAQFGLVQQEPVLFNYSVRENISYAKEHATSKEIKDAAIVANAHDFIQEIDHDDELTQGSKEESKFPNSAMQPLRGCDYTDDTCDDLPSGYNTLCGVKGSKFSGGQKQRIAVARAIITQPQLLMLDEATSALDEESQKKVQDALDNVMKETTSIVIAHRLTTIRKCDRLIVLDQGVLSEEGSYDELMRAGGQFAQISSDMQS
ncbi:unnamed protein product [Moneuplotes crassus]|uniref:Uncharacterized protein n=1 Tax=Euplotes crassus TaxID=5936 RepID=A0AAD1UHC4_EUPCR|nr:unnamed protein product [Moneuplotes crassus]